MEWHTTNLALGQHEAGWESSVSFGCVNLEFGFSGDGLHDLLVKLKVCGAVLDEESEVRRAARHDVLASRELECEHVQKNEVLLVLVNVINVSVAIVLWSEVGADDTLGGLLNIHVQFVCPWDIVQTERASLDDEVFSLIVGNLSEFLQIRVVSGLLIVNLNIDGVGDISIEAIEIGDQFVDLDGLNLDSWEGDLLISVVLKVILEFPVQIDDAFVQLVEHWVAERGLELLQNAWDDLVIFEVLDGSSEEDLAVDFQIAEETNVDGIWVGLDNVAQVFNGLWLGQIDLVAAGQNNESLVNGITNATLVVLNFLNQMVVALSEELIMVVSCWEWNSVVVVHIWVISGLDWCVPCEFWDCSQIVGQTLQVVTGQKLLVMEKVELSTTVLVQVEFFASHPVWEICLEVVVPSVQTDIFSEVRHLLLWVGVHVPEKLIKEQLVSYLVQFRRENLPSSIVGGNCDGVDILDLLHAIESLHLVLVSLLDDLRVEEIVWVDFIDGWNLNSLQVLAMEDGGGQCVHEHAFVDVETSPGHDLVESFPILGIVEDVEEGDDLLLLDFIQNGEDFIEIEETMMVQGHEFFDGLNIGV